jgi:hypothetical protein
MVNVGHQKSGLIGGWGYKEGKKYLEAKGERGEG